MYKRHSVLILIAQQCLFIAVPSLPRFEQNQTDCEDGWILHNTKCYYLTAVALTWRKSLQACRALNSSIATISSIDEKVRFRFAMQLLVL